MFRKIKIVFSVLFLLALLAPQVSFALDTRCWTEQSCTDGGGAFYKPTAETMGVCGGETTLGSSGKPEPVSFCLPAGQAQTQVGFSGKKTFVNFGDFIKWIYQYGIQVAAVLAVIMIIVAGIQWATSAGSSERVSSARKRIGGALMGLFLALLSYMLLNLINPYMVNLRMPQVWKINTLGLTPPFCDMITDGKKVSADKPNGPFDIDPTDTKKTICGKDYFVQGTSGLTCKGKSCASDSTCMPFSYVAGADKKETFTGPSACFDGGLIIREKVDKSLENYFKAWFANNLCKIAGTQTKILYQPKWQDTDFFVAVWPVCRKGDARYIAKKIEYNELQTKYINKGLHLDKEFYNEYVYQFTNLEDKIKSGGGCGSDKIDGVIVQHELFMCGGSNDWNLFIGGDSGIAVGGVWNEPNGPTQHFIPMEAINNKGVFLDFSMTNSILERIGENADTKDATPNDTVWTSILNAIPIIG